MNYHISAMNDQILHLIHKTLHFQQWFEPMGQVFNFVFILWFLFDWIGLGGCITQVYYATLQIP